MEKNVCSEKKKNTPNLEEVQSKGAISSLADVTDKENGIILGRINRIHPLNKIADPNHPRRYVQIVILKELLVRSGEPRLEFRLLTFDEIALGISSSNLLISDYIAVYKPLISKDSSYSPSDTRHHFQVILGIRHSDSLENIFVKRAGWEHWVPVCEMVSMKNNVNISTVNNSLRKKRIVDITDSYSEKTFNFGSSSKISYEQILCNQKNIYKKFKRITAASSSDSGSESYCTVEPFTQIQPQLSNFSEERLSNNEDKKSQMEKQRSGSKISYEQFLRDQENTYKNLERITIASSFNSGSESYCIRDPFIQVQLQSYNLSEERSSNNEDKKSRMEKQKSISNIFYKQILRYQKNTYKKFKRITAASSSDSESYCTVEPFIQIQPQSSNLSEERSSNNEDKKSRIEKQKSSSNIFDEQNLRYQKNTYKKFKRITVAPSSDSSSESYCTVEPFIPIQSQSSNLSEERSSNNEDKKSRIEKQKSSSNIFDEQNLRYQKNAYKKLKRITVAPSSDSSSESYCTVEPFIQRQSQSSNSSEERSSNNEDKKSRIKKQKSSSNIFDEQNLRYQKNTYKKFKRITVAPSSDSSSESYCTVEPFIQRQSQSSNSSEERSSNNEDKKSRIEKQKSGSKDVNLFTRAINRPNIILKENSVYPYTKISELTRGTFNVYGVIEKIKKHPTLFAGKRYHAYLYVTDNLESHLPVHIYHLPTENSPILREGYIVRFHRLKVENDGVPVARIFNSNDVVTFDPNDESVIHTTAKNISYTEDDWKRLAQMKKFATYYFRY